MGERDLMALATALVAACVLGLLALKLLRARRGGRSLLAHLGAAADLVCRHHWLAAAPVMLYAVLCLGIRAPSHARTRAILARSPGTAFGLRQHWSAQLQPAVLAYTIGRAARGLMLPLASACQRSWFSPLVLVVAFGFLRTRLRALTDEWLTQRMAALTTAVRILFWVLVPVYVVYIVYYTCANALNGMGALEGWMPLLLPVLQFGWLAMAVAGLLLYALLEAYVLLYARALMLGRPPDVRQIWNGALLVLLPLMGLQVLWFFVSGLAEAVGSLGATANRLGVPWAPQASEAAQAILPWCYALTGLVAAAFCFAPCFIVVRQERLGEALLSAVAFVRDHFRAWLAAVVVCVALAGLPRIVFDVAAALLPAMSWGAFGLGFFGGAGQIVGLEMAAIVLLGVFLDRVGDEDTDRGRGRAATQSG